MSSESITRNTDRAWVAETVRRIQRCDAVEAHFELLFRCYEPRIRRKLGYMGWNGADLDDLVQDVMVRVYRGLGSFRLDASFDTWILQIMSNAARNAARDRSTGKARATRASLEGLLERDGDSGPVMAEPAGTGDGPLDDALGAERKARLSAALAPSPDRGPFTLELTRGDGTTATVAGLKPGIGGVFMLDLPRGDLADGVHELRLSDRDGQSVARFQLEVEVRQ